MDISIVIPALDEEKRIGGVVGQFKKLKGKFSYEVIVADGGSKDKTILLAKKAGAKVFQNPRGKQTIAKNRNLGARKAKGKVIIFCDADTRLKDVVKFVGRVVEVFKDSKVVAGMPKIRVFPARRIWSDKIFHFFYNSLMKLSFKIKAPFSSGQCQIVRRGIFSKIKGYDEKIIHGEDSELFKRMDDQGKLHYFSDLAVYESPRRYRKYGYMRLICKSVFSILYQAIFKKNILTKWERVEG